MKRLSLLTVTAVFYVSCSFFKAAEPEALTISQAQAAQNAKAVWVGGFVAGGDLSAKGMSFAGPFSSATNLAIGPESGTAAKSECIAVQLPAGKVRDALNLPGHPELLGKYILLKGDIVPGYFGITGLKNTSDYLIK